jgi:hypothetical protein
MPGILIPPAAWPRYIVNIRTVGASLISHPAQARTSEDPHFCMLNGRRSTPSLLINIKATDNPAFRPHTLLVSHAQQNRKTR